MFHAYESGNHFLVGIPPSTQKHARINAFNYIILFISSQVSLVTTASVDFKTFGLRPPHGKSRFKISVDSTGMPVKESHFHRDFNDFLERLVTRFIQKLAATL